MSHKLSKTKRGEYLLLGTAGQPVDDQRAVDAIKGLPAHARRWDVDINAWRIAEGFGGAAQALLDGIARLDERPDH